MPIDNKLKIVLLTNGNVHGIRILAGLKNAGITLDSVVLETKAAIQDYLYPGTQWYALRWIKAFRRFLIHLKLNKHNQAIFEEYSSVIRGGTLNSETMCKEIEKLKPDLIILGGIGIICERIINIPSKGVLNTHPGILPWLRGSGVVSRAIERRLPIGVTSHYVDSKIDTGSVIERRLVPLMDKYYSLLDLERMADELASEMMIDTITRIVQGRRMPQGYPQNIKFPICKRMDEDEKLMLADLLNERIPYKQYKKWSVYCSIENKIDTNIDFEMET